MYLTQQFLCRNKTLTNSDVEHLLSDMERRITNNPSTDIKLIKKLSKVILKGNQSRNGQLARPCKNHKSKIITNSKAPGTQEEPEIRNQLLSIDLLGFLAFFIYIS